MKYPGLQAVHFAKETQAVQFRGHEIHFELVPSSK
jgi:hypothetical protein